MMEKNYDFRKRLDTLHIPRLQEDAAPVDRTQETPVTQAWRIVPSDPEDRILMHAVRDLQDYFLRSMDLDLPLGKEKSTNTIFVGIKPEKNIRTARICANADSIDITGATSREAAQGCYRLEDELNLRGCPAVRHGDRTYTRMFAPRMTHSGYEIEIFPDTYLDQVAHAGMDAIIIFIEEPPDVTRNGKLNMPEVVAHAAEYGIDVYAYASFPVLAAKMHPCDPGAREYYEEIYGSIIRNAPGIKGMVFVGESVAFPSHDPRTDGYWWKRGAPGKNANGFFPSPDWADWLNLVKEVTRKYNPDLDLLFWTYNWFWCAKKDRLTLLETIPTGITLHVTFEMGDDPVEKCGIRTGVDDYSITSAGPGTTFSSEAEVAARRGIRLTSMTNTGGRTWDCGVIPYEPVPYCWQKRFAAMRKAAADWGLAGTMESHHYGFAPNTVSELAKYCFTEEFDMADFERLLTAIAERDFGKENAPHVIAAWKDWSDAFYWHSAKSCDQYGPLRTGPTYPFTLPGETMPDPLHPHYEYYDGIKHGTGWKYLSPTYRYPLEDLDNSIVMTEKELVLLKSGCDKMDRAVQNLSDTRRENALRLAGIGEFLYHTIRTLLNVKKYYRAGLRLQDAEKNGEDTVRAEAAAEMRAILKDEEQNVRETIPLVERDSHLGWEPSMLYVADKENLEWKLDQLQSCYKVL